jgi:rfaE bifunctional protein nucleotidyltransferase chain/domain
LGKSIVFTNGVFDILHPGHIFSLSQAAREADFLIVGVNSDNSVKRLKGQQRPVNNQDSRALILASLLMVDAVVIFEEDTPLELVKQLKALGVRVKYDDNDNAMSKYFVLLNYKTPFFKETKIFYLFCYYCIIIISKINTNLKKKNILAK